MFSENAFMTPDFPSSGARPCARHYALSELNYRDSIWGFTLTLQTARSVRRKLSPERVCEVRVFAGETAVGRAEGAVYQLDTWATNTPVSTRPARLTCTKIR